MTRNVCHAANLPGKGLISGNPHSKISDKDWWIRELEGPVREPEGLKAGRSGV